MTSFGVMFRRDYAPELLKHYAPRIEAAGFDELWVVEDLGFKGGFSQAVAALAWTEHLTVGLGIVPAVVRNPAFLAMEWATTARMFPGRFHCGLGHGVETWIDQVGARPVSWLRSLEEVTVAAKRLLAGEDVTIDGQHVHLDHVRLTYPVLDAPSLVSFGVRQPRSIELARRVADGVILAEMSGPRYVAQSREAIGPDSRLTVFVNVSADIDAVHREVDLRISQGRFGGQMKVYEGSGVDLHDELVIAGEPAMWRTQSQRWIDAGADAVVWVPLTSSEPSVLDRYIDAFRMGRPS